MLYRWTISGMIGCSAAFWNRATEASEAQSSERAAPLGNTGPAIARWRAFFFEGSICLPLVPTLFYEPVFTEFDAQNQATLALAVTFENAIVNFFRALRLAISAFIVSVPRHVHFQRRVKLVPADQIDEPPNR